MADMRVDAESGDEFSADEVSVSHSPVRFVIDFKSVAPRVDMTGQQPRLVVKHNVVKLEPFLLKEVIGVLAENVKKFEEKFGPIERPKALKMAEERSKDKQEGTVKQNYFG